MKWSLLISDLRFSKIFLFGIVSGMPFALLASTLVAWANSFDVAFATVTLLAVTRVPYSLKFLWSPIIDYARLPLLCHLLGRRRSWMFVATLTTAAITYHFSHLEASSLNFRYILLLGTLIGFCAATYDIAYDALRIEMLEPELQALGVAHASLAFRVGCILTGAYAIAYVDAHGWQAALRLISMLFLGGSILCLLLHTNELQATSREKSITKYTISSFKDLLYRDNMILILMIIIVYKLGDAMLAFVGMKFYVVAGFTLTEIAWVVKTFGLIASFVGSYVASAIIARVGGLRGLMICGAAQMITNLGYIWLNHSHGNLYVFFISNFSENFTGGMGATALSAYISNLCNIKFAANQFALLSACASLMNNSLTATSGKLVEWLGWDLYFVFTTVISLPALLMIHILSKRLEQKNAKAPGNRD